MPNSRGDAAHVDESRRSIVPLLGIAVVALAGLALPRVPVPRLDIFGPITFAFATLGDVATAAVLISTWRLSQARRSTFALSMVFVVSAILMLLAMLALPMMPQVLPVFPVSPRVGAWLYMEWHLVAAFGTLIYVGLRRRGHSEPLRRFVTEATFVAVVAAVAAAALAFAFSDRLPALADRVAFTGLMSSGLGPIAAALLVLAAIVAFRVRNPSTIDRALGYASLALALDMVLLIAGGPRFTLAFYAGRASVLLGSSFVLIAAVQTLVKARTKLYQMEWKLARSEGESSKRAGRIRALWQITQDETLSQHERFDAVMVKATLQMRPGKPMFGCLTHLEGETIVVDATSWLPAQSAARFTDSVFPGATFAFRNTMQSVLLTDNCTKWWDDLSCVGDVSRKASEELGWRSLIGTPLTIGRKSYFLTFSSPETMLDEPYAEDDVAYVEVVASFFANRFAQQMQFERIQFQIEHDALTGLENRVEFRKAIRKALAAGEPFAVAFLDLDGFRHVNERQGHQVADEILVEVAAGLAAVGDGDLVARMGGDEFGVLIRGVSTVESGRLRLERYAHRFLTPFHTGDRLGTQMLRVGASIGAARFPADGATAEDLMLCADAALAAAKSRGGSSMQMFDAQMEALMQQSHLRVVELADAIAGGQLDLVYQPTFDLATRAMTGAEALIRWDHPERGRLLPVDFIPLAERNELITPLTRCVIARIIRDLTHGPALPKGFRVYFNISAQTLGDARFVAELKETLTEHDGLAAHLGVEMTETAAMDDVESATDTIDLLRRWGLYVAIDDFGTGYSSLSYLKKLSVDVIKIDRTFVTGLPDDEGDGAITEMLLRITDRFGFKTLAEGIETEAQVAWLLAHGCRAGQGFLLAKPDTYASLLRRLVRPLAIA
jgi:diguanylate cyclase (GGDEF)-like protein